MGDIRATQSFVLGSTSSEGGDARVSSAGILAATQFPSEEARSTATGILATVVKDVEVRVPRVYILAAVKGSIYDPKVRAWPYTLDGHDHYVMRLGGLEETIVYDDHSEAFYTWGSRESDKWRAYTGCNWQGAESFANEYGSNVVVGDDANGALYFLDPEADKDDSPLYGGEEQWTFERKAMAQALTRGYDKVKCYGVNLLGSIGENTSVEAELTAVTLYTSDNLGHTYENRGTLNVTPGGYNDRLQWRSLGSFSAPGRLFRIEDAGALKRIDYLEMEDGQAATGA